LKALVTGEPTQQHGFTSTKPGLAAVHEYSFHLENKLWWIGALFAPKADMFVSQ